MWVFAVIAVMVAALLPSMPRQGDGERGVESGQDSAMAERMAVYRTAVAAWARTHPGFEGPVDASSVETPAWWRGHPSLHATVDGRFVAVYLTGPEAVGVLDEMLRLSGGSIMVGYASRATGTLHSPTIGDTGIQVPDGVPDKAPVWLALRD